MEYSQLDQAYNLHILDYHVLTHACMVISQSYCVIIYY